MAAADLIFWTLLSNIFRTRMIFSKMKQCKNFACNKAIDKDADFCPKCGARQEPEARAEGASDIIAPPRYKLTEKSKQIENEATISVGENEHQEPKKSPSFNLISLVTHYLIKEEDPNKLYLAFCGFFTMDLIMDQILQVSKKKPLDGFDAGEITFIWIVFLVASGLLIIPGIRSGKKLFPILAVLIYGSLIIPAIPDSIDAWSKTSGSGGIFFQLMMLWDTFVSGLLELGILIRLVYMINPDRQEDES